MRMITAKEYLTSLRKEINELAAEYSVEMKDD